MYPVGTVLLALILWDLGVRLFGVQNFILPPPLYCDIPGIHSLTDPCTPVLESLVEDMGLIAPHAFFTLQEVLLGFFFSVVIGIPLAVVIVSWRVAEKSIYPLLVTSQVVPKIAIAPLFIIWFGFGMTPKVIVAFLIAFFPIVVDTAIGLRSLEVEKLYLARSMGASTLQTFFKLRLPNAMPYIFSGLKLSITFAVTGAIVGEFIGADRGIGRVILMANGSFDTALLFAAVTALTIMGIILFLIIDVAERFVVRWHVSQRIDTHAQG